MTQSVKYGPNFPVLLFIFSENIKDKCKNIEKNAIFSWKKFASTSKNTHPPPAYVPEILCMSPHGLMCIKSTKANINFVEESNDR